jgi:hypothetical protein
MLIPQKHRTTYDVAIPVLRIYPKVPSGTPRDICASVFIEALFAIAEGRSNPSGYWWMNG